jgi:hypothetical protein
VDRCETIRVNPWGEDQGDFVEINAEDFDPAIHTKFGEKPAQPDSPKPAKRRAKKA